MKTKLTRTDRKFIDRVDHMNHKQIRQLKLEKYIGHRYWEHLRVPKLSWDLKPLFYINDTTYKIPKKNHKSYYTRKHYKGELVLIRIKNKGQFDCYWRIRFEIMGCSSKEWKDTELTNDNDMPCIHYAKLMNKKRSDVRKRVLAAKGIKPKKPKQPKSNDDNNNQSNNGLNNNNKRPNPYDDWVTKAMNMKL